MDRASLRPWLRRLTCGLWAAGLPLWAGCSHQVGRGDYPAAPPPSARPSNIVPASHSEPATLPPPIEEGAHPPAPAVAKELPISLDTVLRLAEQSNPRIGLAREQLNESL